MVYPNLEEFISLTKKGNVIPVFKEISADLDTPVSAFLKIKKDKYAFLLESVEGQEKIARFSFLGSNPHLTLRSKGRQVTLVDSFGKIKKEFITSSDPLAELKKIMQDFKAVTVKGLPRFCGGMVGYMGYECVKFFEEIPDSNPDDLKVPDCVFMLVDNLFVFDHINHTIKIVSNIILPDKNSGKNRNMLIKLYNKAKQRIEESEKQLKSNLVKQKKVNNEHLSLKSNLSENAFETIVNKGKAYINRGDIIQVVLSQRFNLKSRKKPFEIYRTLRKTNPSPYMFFLMLDDLHLVGSSPEMLVRCEDGIVRTRPIAGTRPRGRSEEEDTKLANELLNDAKERAEHIMLVDLGRNDLGRVCKKGSVKVNEFMKVERYSHVMHIVSEVMGKLESKFDAYDCLRACFPAGTLSGSPKIRAMEIIDELENVKRGPYAGCVGYFSFSHNMDTCITIRTILVKKNSCFIQAGAGIVADSVPKKEYQETVNKAKALIEAIITK